jgi:hypothetical protein
MWLGSGQANLVEPLINSYVVRHQCQWIKINVDRWVKIL